MYEVRRPTSLLKILGREKTIVIPPETRKEQNALFGGRHWGLSNKTKRKYFDAQEYVHRLLQQKTNTALRQKNTQFQNEHAHDTKLQLLAYVRQCAEELGHTPHKEEIIGGAFIAYRFDTWSRVIAEAGLPPMGKLPSLTQRKIYQDEMRCQSAAYHNEKADRKAVRAAERAERSRLAKLEFEQRKARDFAWGDAHSMDTDEQLLDYIRTLATELGHTPVAKEVVGGEYIRKRFNTWAIMCTVAELPLPKELKAPKQREMTEYLKNRKRLM